MIIVHERPALPALDHFLAFGGPVFFDFIDGR
jgi:hypothetical protein